MHFLISVLPRSVFSPTVCRAPQEGAEAEGRLYQTRGGAFFAITKITDKVWNESTEEPEQRVRTECDPLSREGAHKWMMDGDVEVYDNPFDDPPEASAS